MSLRRTRQHDIVIFEDTTGRKPVLRFGKVVRDMRKYVHVFAEGRHKHWSVQLLPKREVTSVFRPRKEQK